MRENIHEKRLMFHCWKSKFIEYRNWKQMKASTQQRSGIKKKWKSAVANRKRRFDVRYGKLIKRKLRRLVSCRVNRQNNSRTETAMFQTVFRTPSRLPKHGECGQNRCRVSPQSKSESENSWILANASIPWNRLWLICLAAIFRYTRTHTQCNENWNNGKRFCCQKHVIIIA